MREEMLEQAEKKRVATRLSARILFIAPYLSTGLSMLSIRSSGRHQKRFRSAQEALGECCDFFRRRIYSYKRFAGFAQAIELREKMRSIFNSKKIRRYHAFE